MIKKFLIRYFPTIGKYKRFMKACIHVISPTKSSYSQYKEDEFIFNVIKKYDFTNSIYIDIGANHPTDISNTYLFYRNGFNGILIEPNQELAWLNKFFRKRDIVLPYGCGNENILGKFYISKTPVLSSFKQSDSADTWKMSYIPIFRLDSILNPFDVQSVFLLSIDVEGLNFEVLEGSINTLKKVKILCIEADTNENKNIMELTSKLNFQLLKATNCNLIFINKDYLNL
jgi:FkbM family methyltransferase